MWSEFLRNKVLDKLLRGANFSFPTYVSLHDDDPGLTGDNEIAGGSYARVLVSAGNWGPAAAGQAVNIATITFVDMPAVTVTHIGLWDDPVAGNFGMGGPLDSPITVGAGDGFVIPISAAAAQLEAGSV